MRETIDDYQKRIKIAREEQGKAAKELSKWGDLMLASIEGTCVFTPVQIRERMDKLQTVVSDLSERIHELEEAAQNAESIANEIRQQHQRLLSWADMYTSASPEEKKIIASYLIKAVTLSRGYELQVEFQINEAQFLQGMEMG